MVMGIPAMGIMVVVTGTEAITTLITITIGGVNSGLTRRKKSCGKNDGASMRNDDRWRPRGKRKVIRHLLSSENVVLQDFPPVKTNVLRQNVETGVAICAFPGDLGV
jgi:hypothetical protein